MDVPLSTMRMSIKQIYDSDTWKERVDKMHRNQVLAIYLRYKSCRFKPELFKHKNPGYEKQAAPIHCKYTCNACGAVYIRDNPCLTECEECGSSDIEKETV